MSSTVAGSIDLYSTQEFYLHLQTANINMGHGYLIGIYGFNEGPKISNNKFKGDYNIMYYTRGYRCSFHNFDNNDVIGYYLLISDAIPTNIWDKLVKWFNLDIKYRRCIIHNLFMAENNSSWSYNFVTTKVNFNSTTHQEITGNNCYFLRDDLRKLIDFAGFSGLTRTDLDHDDYSDRLITDQIKYLCEKISIDCDTYEILVSRNELQDLINKTMDKILLNPDTQDLYKIMRYTRCYGDWFGFVFKPNWNKENDWFDKQIPDKYPTITKLELADNWEQQINTIINSDDPINKKLTECLKVGNIEEIQNNINTIIANVDNYLRDELKTMIENIANLVKVSNKIHTYFNNNSSGLLPKFRTFMNSYMYLLDRCKQIAECSIDDNYGVRFPTNYKCYMNINEPDQTESRKKPWTWIKNILDLPVAITASYLRYPDYFSYGYGYITKYEMEEPELYSSLNDTRSIIRPRTNTYVADIYNSSNESNVFTINFCDGRPIGGVTDIGEEVYDYTYSNFFRWLHYNEKAIIGDSIIPSSSIIAMIFGNIFRLKRDNDNGIIYYDFDYAIKTPTNIIWFLKGDIDEILDFVKRKSGQVFAYAGQSKLVNIFRDSEESPLQLTYTIESLTRFAYPLYNIWRFQNTTYRAMAFDLIFMVRDTTETSVPVFKITSQWTTIGDFSKKFKMNMLLTEEEYTEPTAFSFMDSDFRVGKIENNEYADTTPGDASKKIRIVNTDTGSARYLYKTLTFFYYPGIPLLHFDFEDMAYNYKLPLPYTIQNDERVWINTREEYEQWINQYNAIQIKYLELLLKMVDYCTKRIDYVDTTMYGLECYSKEDIKDFVEYSKQLFKNEITLCNDYFTNYFIGENKLQQFYDRLEWSTMTNEEKSIAYRHITLGRVEVNTDGQIIYSVSMIADIFNNLNLLYSKINSKECYYITETNSDSIEMVDGAIEYSSDRCEFWSRFKGDENTMEKYLQRIEPIVFIQDIRYYSLKPDRFKYVYILDKTDFNQSKQLVMSKYDYDETDITGENYINRARLDEIGINSFTKYLIN